MFTYSVAILLMYAITGGVQKDPHVRNKFSLFLKSILIGRKQVFYGYFTSNLGGLGRLDTRRSIYAYLELACLRGTARTDLYGNTVPVPTLSELSQINNYFGSVRRCLPCAFFIVVRILLSCVIF